MSTERRFWLVVGLAAVIAVGTASCLEPRSPNEDAGDAPALDASADSGDAAKTCDLVGDRCEGDGCCSGPMTGTLVDLERNCSMPPERVFGCAGQTPSGACVPHTQLPSCVQRVTEGGTEVFGTSAGYVSNLNMLDPAYEACSAEVERQVLAIDTRCDE